MSSIKYLDVLSYSNRPKSKVLGFTTRWYCFCICLKVSVCDRITYALFHPFMSNTEDILCRRRSISFMSSTKPIRVDSSSEEDDSAPASASSSATNRKSAVTGGTTSAGSCLILGRWPRMSSASGLSSPGAPAA